jgi:hypothetical protein
VLERIHGAIVAIEETRDIGLHHERPGAVRLLGAGAVEILDRRPGMAAVEPLVAGAEAVAGKLCIRADRLDLPRSNLMPER